MYKSRDAEGRGRGWPDNHAVITVGEWDGDRLSRDASETIVLVFGEVLLHLIFDIFALLSFCVVVSTRCSLYEVSTGEK